MEWLMNVSNVMKKESHSGRETVGFRMTLKTVGLDLLELVCRHVVVLLVDPCIDGFDSLGSVMGIWNEIRIVIN